jgi:hypothetical protein
MGAYSFERGLIMPFYKIEKVMEYTKTVYVEADNEHEADRKFYDTRGKKSDVTELGLEHVTEITQEEFEDNQ